MLHSHQRTQFEVAVNEHAQRTGDLMQACLLDMFLIHHADEFRRFFGDLPRKPVNIHFSGGLHSRR